MPPLMKIVGGWVPRLITLPLPADLGKPGETRREWEVSLDMMMALPHAAIRPLYFRSRLPMLIFPLLTLLVVWIWARRLYSELTAFTLAALFALEPTALAHGALFKNDLAASFTYLLFWFAAWNFAKAPSALRALAVGAAAALAMLSKLSLLFVLPLAFLLILACGRRIRAVAWAASALALAYLIILAAYRFDARPLTTQEIERPRPCRTFRPGSSPPHSHSLGSRYRRPSGPGWSRSSRTSSSKSPSTCSERSGAKATRTTSS